MVEDERAEEIERRIRALLHMAGIIALATLGLMVIVVAICWFAGWRSASQISSAMSWAGGIAIATGVLSTLGGWGVTRIFRLCTPSRPHTRTQRPGPGKRYEIRSAATTWRLWLWWQDCCV